MWHLFRFSTRSIYGFTIQQYFILLTGGFQGLVRSGGLSGKACAVQYPQFRLPF